MGIGGISIWQMLIVLAIIILIFGTKKLRNAGGDLGAAVSNFKNQMKSGEEEVTGDPEKLERADAEFEQSTTAAKESADTKNS